MDFELSEEQRLFRDTIRDFVAKEIEPVASEWEAADRRYFSEASMTELTATTPTIDEAVILPEITAA